MDQNVGCGVHNQNCLHNVSNKAVSSSLLANNNNCVSFMTPNGAPVRTRCCSPTVAHACHSEKKMKKKTWSELKCVVTESRRQIMSSMSSMVPANVNFRRLSDGRVRIYFLGTPPNGFEHTLLYVDVNPCANATNPTVANLSCPSSSNPNNNTSVGGSSSSSSGGSGNNSSSIISMPAAVSSIASLLNGVSGNTVHIGSPSDAKDETSAVVGMASTDPTCPHSRMQLHWNLVLEPTISSLNNNNAPCSREVQLLLERKRLSTWGMTSYELHKESGRIVYPSASTLYQCLDTGFTSGPNFPTELRISPLWAAFDPQICPQNSDLVAYVCGGDIWVTHTVSGHVERLTYARDGHRPFAEDPVSAGVPSYVIQEEFIRFQGFWWQPHSDDGIYRIAYEEVDESDVGLVTFPTSLTQAAGDDYEEYRFPRAGTPNAKSKLKLVQFRLSETLQITEIWVKDLNYPLSCVFPWMEYLVRVGWTPDSKYVWAQLVNRLQQRLDVVLIPLDNFNGMYSSPSESPTGKPSQSAVDDHQQSAVGAEQTSLQCTPIQVVYSEKSATWINVHDVLHFLEVTDTSCTIIWASEETNYRHLYLITAALDLTTRANDLENLMMDQYLKGGADCEGGQQMDTDERTINNTLLQAKIINKVALTHGEWEVLGSRIWVDKERQLVFFQGLRESPLEKHLYVISLQQPGHVRLLSKPGSSYTVQINEDCTIMMQTFCNIYSLPTCEVLKVAQSCQLGGVNGLQLSSMGYLLRGGAPENPHFCPTIYTEQLDNAMGSETIYALVYKPHNFRLGVKYPTVLNIYGGPEVQIVNNTFKGMRQLRMHMLASQGYCVVCIDSRGSQHRGVKFESHLRKRMGTVELADQVEILQKLSKQLGYIDMERIAIHGWSYGGYLSLMGLVHYPSIFKLAIAGAPVTNWEYYDTGYTERYMDMPMNNREGYYAGSVLNYVNKFPDEENRLLIIHGLIDENVHFSHTAQLINALVKLNKPYQLQVYPHERHSLRNLDASKHYETTLLSFLQNNL